MHQTLPDRDFQAPRDVLKARVAATARRDELADAVAEMMQAKGKQAVTFFDGCQMWVATCTGKAVALTPAATVAVLSLGDLLPRCEVPDRYQDGAHAATLTDERVDPFPKLQRFNPEMQPMGDADALFAQFMDRIQSGGIDVPSDDDREPIRPMKPVGTYAGVGEMLESFGISDIDLTDDDIDEAAEFAAITDLFAPPSARHVRPSVAELARAFAVPDDEDEGLDEALDDLDDEDFDAVPEPDDSERTTEFPPVSVPADDVAASQNQRI